MRSGSYQGRCGEPCGQQRAIHARYDGGFKVNHRAPLIALLFVLPASLVGCGRARTPAEWADALAPEVEARSSALTACYEKSGLGRSTRDADRRALVIVDVVADPGTDTLVDVVEGTEHVLKVKHSERTTQRTNQALTDCVIATLKDIPYPTDDRRRSEGSWWFVFDPSEPSRPAAGAQPSTGGT